VNRRQRRAAASSARRGPGEPPAAQSPASMLRDQVSAASASVSNATLSKEKTPANVYALYEGAVAVGESYISRSPVSPNALACHQGCDHCCHRPVGTTAPSVLRIASALRANLSHAEFTGVLARVVALDEKTHGRPWIPTQRAPLPCAFLVKGACSIYAMRPLVCRAWNSTDAEDCRRALTQQSTKMRFDLYQRTTFAAVEDGIREALRTHGLDASDLELTAAMRAAMENPEASEEWLEGKPVFAGCKADPAEAGRRSLPLAAW
jgi:Fe-S-cluster containining protein